MYPRDQDGGAEMAADMYFGLYTYLVVHVYSPASTESTTSTVQQQQSDPNLMTSWIIAIYSPLHTTTTKVERRCYAKDERPTGKGDLHIG